MLGGPFEPAYQRFAEAVAPAAPIETGPFAGSWGTPAAPERRLLESYAKGLRADGVEWDPIVERTDGSSAAFLREVLRQAALQGATDDAEPPLLEPTALLDVLADLTNSTRSMSLRLLGSSSRSER